MDTVAVLDDGVLMEGGEFVGEVAAVVASAAFFAFEGAFGDQSEDRPDVADFVVDAGGVAQRTLGEFAEFVIGVGQGCPIAFDSAVGPGEGAEFFFGDGREIGVLGGERGVAFQGREFAHGFAGAFAEDYAFQERIAGEAVGAVDSRRRNFAGGVESGDVGASEEVGLDSSHGVVGGGVDGGGLGGGGR